MPVQAVLRVNSTDGSSPILCSARVSEDDNAGHLNPSQGRPGDVWLHVYHCDPYTAWLNKWVLKRQEMPICHVGVEVYGEEWCFQYFEDCWDDESISGVMHCIPKRMVDYDYQESINLGATPLSGSEVDELLMQLHYEWPASSYHLTRRNCLTFAQTLCGKLRTPEEFPLWIKAIVDASNNNAPVDAMVDYGWSWAKWWMLRKHQQPEQDSSGAMSTSCCGGANAGSDRQASMWTLLLEPSYACSGKVCMGVPKGRIEGVEEPRDAHGRPENRYSKPDVAELIEK